MAIQLNPFAKSPTTRARWLPDISSDYLPHYQKIALELDLRRRARAEGVENRPVTENRSLDETEQKVIERIREGIHLLRQFLLDQMHRAMAQVQARLPTRIDPEASVTQAQAQVEHTKHSDRDRLERLSLEELRKRRQLRKFRADHDLGRDASYARHRLFPIALIISMIAVEMSFNSLLFAKASPLGYVGGAFQALIFGVINVAIGFFTGWIGVRLAGHRNSGLKALGVMITILGLMVGAWWNLMVARFRDLLEHDPDAKVFDIGIRPSLEWLQLSTIESWALFILGLIIFCAAVIEGRGGRAGFSDPYVGYRGVDLAHKESGAHYLAAKDEHRAAVQGAIDDVRKQLKARFEADARQLKEIREIVSASSTRRQEVRDSVNEWAALGSNLLKLYREENIRVRTSPAPAHFNHYPTYEAALEGLADDSHIRALAKEAEAIVASNESAIANAENRLVQLGTKEADGFLSEIDDIESRAARKLQEEWEQESLRSTNDNVSRLPQQRRVG